MPILKRLSKATITLDTIEMADVDKGTGPAFSAKPERQSKFSKRLGDEFPIVQINDYLFTYDEVLEVEIDTSEFIPKIEIELGLIRGSFVSKSFIKDGDIASIYIRSKNNTFLEIRNDYEIISVDTGDSGDASGNAFLMTISGRLRVPKLLAEYSQSYTGTSLQVLQQIANELKLGFVTNETSTNDSMTWISSYDTRKDFIETITKHSWKNIDSFFVSFIDVYYNLNFINYNTQIISKEQPLPAIFEYDITTDNTDNDIIFEEGGLIFTNADERKHTNFFIEKHRLINNSGSLNRKNGYVKKIQLFDHNNLRTWDFTLEALVTPENEKNRTVLKGRVGENLYKNEIKSKWLGVQYSTPTHNVHENYKYAVLHNYMNIKELDKLNLMIGTRNVNLNVIKLQNVHCAIIVDDDGNRIHDINSENESLKGDPMNIPIAYDNFLSGLYTVKDIIIRYTKELHFRTEFYLTRREYPIPAVE